MSYRRTGGFVVANVIAALFWAGAAQAADALIDAKRQAAAELAKQGKNHEATTLLTEVVLADPGNYRDHLALARAFDKLNKGPETAAAYHRVIDLLAAGTVNDRTAQQEAEKRLKLLEAQTAKVQAAADEFLKKLDALEREAIAGKDATAVRRIFRLKAALYRAAERSDRTGFEVDVQRAWEPVGFKVTAGRSYRVRAVGTFVVAPGVESGPDGSAGVPENYQGPVGLLLLRIGDRPDLIKAGSASRFTAAHTGPLMAVLNGTQQEKARASGTITLLIEAE